MSGSLPRCHDKLPLIGAQFATVRSYRAHATKRIAMLCAQKLIPCEQIQHGDGCDFRSQWNSREIDHEVSVVVGVGVEPAQVNFHERLSGDDVIICTCLN